MPTRRLTLPAVAALALACLVLGALAALADGDAKHARHHRAAARPAMPPLPRHAPTPPLAEGPLRPALRQRAPGLPAVPYAGPLPTSLVYDARPCTPPSHPRQPAAEPVPDDILKAFGVLRRDKAPGDELPAEALTALRPRGLVPFDPAAARLLRKQADGGQAWIVPVRDVTELPFIACPVRLANPRFLRPATPTAPPSPAAPAKPHPGVAIVAVGGAPVGAGGRLEDVIRGREPVAVDPCGGPSHDMLSVSGIVPDGVPAAFLTSPDGTAIRADVSDNAYAFVVPRSNRPEQRYVVWTGGDGTPHVQPLAGPMLGTRYPCKTIVRMRAHLAPAVSPDGSGVCGRYLRFPAPNVLYDTPCVLTPARIPPQLPNPPSKRHK